MIRPTRHRHVYTFVAGALGFALWAAPSSAEAQSECQTAVQGKIAWDYKGTKRWAPKNLQRLCRGVNSKEPAKCFRRVMHGGVEWGSGTKWKWENAIDLCERSQNASRTVGCFQSKYQRLGWKKAIASCDERAPQIPPPSSAGLGPCRGALQGKVAWDYKGSKQWASNNLKRLCRRSENSVQPARCFEKVMHGGVSWGSSTRWKWENAVDLCERSPNARRTVKCFQSKISQGVPWKQAIASCDERTGGEGMASGGGGLRYGDFVTIQATATRWAGHNGYLSPCGGAGACGVGVTLRPDNEFRKHEPNSNLRRWRILGGRKGSPLRYGDVVRLRATAKRWAGHNGFLSPCGSAGPCGVGVTLRPDSEFRKHEPNSNLRSWRILGGRRGRPVPDGASIRLKAMATRWAGHDGFLSPCGGAGPCGVGVTLRPDSEFRKHEPNSNLRTWVISRHP